MAISNAPPEYIEWNGGGGTVTLRNPAYTSWLNSQNTTASATPTSGYNPFSTAPSAGMVSSSAPKLPTANTSSLTPNGVTSGSYSATQQPYQYGGRPQADVNLQNQMNIMGMGNPFQNTAQNAANNAGAASGTFGQSTVGQGQGMYGGANAVMNTAFDPQQALYKQLYQQNTDANNVNEAQRGITNSPYGAGVANQAATNFNIDWQNQQLGRQIQGLNAAGTANNTGANLGTSGVTQMNNAGQLPYQTGQQAMANEQQSIQDWLNYLAGGTNASAGNQMAPQLTPVFAPQTVTQSQFGPTTSGGGISWI